MWPIIYKNPEKIFSSFVQASGSISKKYLSNYSTRQIYEWIHNFFQAYGPLLVQKIRHKHTLARNHFSKMSTMANYFKGQSDDQSQTDQISQTGEEDEEHSFTNELSHSLSCSISVKDWKCKV